MAIGEKGRFRELDPDVREAGRVCPAVRIINLTGPLFFAVAGELEAVLERLMQNPELRVLILRLRQTQNFDVTTASILEATAIKMSSKQRTLILLGLRPPAHALLQRTGIADRLGRDNLFLAQAGWFTAMESALRRALELTGEHACGTKCPLAEYLEAQDQLRSTAETATAG
jgi:MFS superfamily sulfate permease-like transporter